MGGVIGGIVLGLFFYYQSRKLNIQLLKYLGLFMFSVGCAWLGVVTDFLTILITGNNLNNTFGLYAMLGYPWGAPVGCLGLYIGAELLLPNIKRYLVPISIILGVFLVLFVLLDTMNTFTFTYPTNPGENIIDASLILTSPAFMILVFYILTALVINGFGCLYKGIHSEGVIRKKYFILSIGFTVFVISSMLETISSPGFLVIIVRIGMVSSVWLWYLGLRKEPEKIKKTSTKKEVKVEGDLFRIIKRPELITEEEITISKEKKSCLVCKGKISGINYICIECGAFYCIKCSQAISNLENACWACNAPIDKSKPVKPFKKVELEDFEISEKTQKLLKTKK